MPHRAAAGALVLIGILLAGWALRRRSQSDLDGNACHTMLSTEWLEQRHTAWNERIHIHARHAMGHDHSAWGDTADRHRWHLERRTRGV